MNIYGTVAVLVGALGLPPRTRGLKVRFGRRPELVAPPRVRPRAATDAAKTLASRVRWEQFDLERGIWTKPIAHTKQNSEHRVPLSTPALALLQALKATNGWIPGQGRAAGHDHQDVLGERDPAGRARDVRVHDLRYSYASILASAGLSLPVIGALLGHTQVSTTNRYAHLLDDPLRVAAEHVGAIVSGKPSGEVVPIKRQG